MAGQEFRTQRTTRKLLLLCNCSLIFAPLITNYICFDQDWIRVPFFQTQPVAFHPSCHSSQLYDQHGSSHHLQIWCARSGAASAHLGHAVGVWTCCSWLSLQVFSSNCSNLSILFIHVREGNKFQGKKKRYTGVNDHVYPWPVVRAILDK